MIPRDECVRRCYEVPGQTWPRELGWLYDAFRASRTHAEIGVYCGRSLLASCGGMAAGSRVYAVDDISEPYGPSPAWGRAVLNATLAEIGTAAVEVLPLPSLDAARRLRSVRFDTVFLDGCHEYAETLADIRAWLPLVRPGGMIAGHDYWTGHVGVMDAVEEAFGGAAEIVSGTRLWCYRPPSP